MRQEAVKRLDELAAGLILDDMANALRSLAGDSRLTAVKLGVASADIANELYHLLFGQVNEQLVKAGFAAAPIYAPGQGRALKCFEMV